MSNRRLPLLGLFVVSIAVAPAGCSRMKSWWTGPKVEREPRPTLAAARDAQITQFGELPERGETPFYSRGMTSLLRHTFTEEGADFDADVDVTGERIVFASTRHTKRPDLYIKSTDGTAVTQLTSDPASDVQPAFSPDGEWVTFASDRAGNWDIWMVRTDGTHARQITRGPEDEVHPSWSPDGKRLVFSSLPKGSGQWEMWIAGAEADGTKKFIGYGLFPEWSPSGDVIAFQRARERGSRWFSIWTVELVQGEPRYPTEIASSPDHAMISPSWDPDGRRLSYCTVASTESDDKKPSGSPGIADIWVVDTDGRSRVRLTDGHTANYGPVWSAQGRIFFTSTRGGCENIWSLSPDEPSPGDAQPVGAISTRGGSGEPGPSGAAL